MGKNTEYFLLAIFIFIGAFLRFYNISKLEYFTYDQARDAIYVKRIVADHRFRLLGTQTSMPGMFLPPYYYYTIAPVLWLAGLNPVGLDFYSATIGVLFIPLIFFVANRFFGSPAGVFASALTSVSVVMVELTRRAWNPNTLPFFILISFFFLYRYFINKKVKDFLLAFFFYGYCLCLHFGAWTLGPLFGLTWLYYGFKNKENKLFGLLVSLIIVAFFVSPLIVFNLKHQFILLNDAKNYFLSSGRLNFHLFGFLESSLTAFLSLFTVLLSAKARVGHGAPLEFSGQLKDLFNLKEPISIVAQRPYSIALPWWGYLLTLLISLFSLWFLFKKEKSLMFLWVWLGWGIFASRFYRGGFFFFYYLYLFPIPFLFFGFFFRWIWQKERLRVPFSVLFCLIILFQLKNTLIFKSPWRNLVDLRAVGKIIARGVNDDQLFNIATIRRDNEFWERNSVDYRYFVETFEKKKPLDWFPEDYSRVKELFVVDETGQAEVLKSNIMEISTFGPQRIIGQWSTEKGIVVYKLTK